MNPDFYSIKQRLLFILALAFSSVAAASDFTPLMIFLLVPFAIVALLIWVLTWLTTKNMQPLYLKILIRTFGLCLIFTPTHTAGGNGKMVSVALYDIVFSSLGGDSYYAVQAIINALVLTLVLSALVYGVVQANKKPKSNN